MKPAERLYTALSGGTPDRVPVVPKIWVDLGAALTGTDLIDVIEEPVTALRVIADASLAAGVDAARQFPFPRRKTIRKGSAVYEVDDKGRVLGRIDMDGGLITQLDDAADYDISDPITMAYHHYWHPPEPAVKGLADADRIAVPDADVFDALGWAANQDVIRAEVGDRIALIGNCSSATMAFYVCLRGLERAMFDLIEQPALVHAVMEKGVEIAVNKGKYWLDHGINILRLNDSVGNMSVISPHHWREFVFPHMKAVCDALHAHDPAARIYCHICGSTLPIAEDLVRTGLDCIGPLDPLGGMTAAQMRGAVGDRVSLMGGVHTLSFVDSTPDQIIEEARRCIEGAGAQGGYVLGSGCVVPRTAKRENLAALVTAAGRYGTYCK